MFALEWFSFVVMLTGFGLVYATVLCFCGGRGGQRIVMVAHGVPAQSSEPRLLPIWISISVSCVGGPSADQSCSCFVCFAVPS